MPSRPDSRPRLQALRAASDGVTGVPRSADPADDVGTAVAGSGWTPSWDAVPGASQLRAVRELQGVAHPHGSRADQADVRRVATRSVPSHGRGSDADDGGRSSTAPGYGRRAWADDDDPFLDEPAHSAQGASCPPVLDPGHDRRLRADDDDPFLDEPADSAQGPSCPPFLDPGHERLVRADDDDSLLDEPAVPPRRATSSPSRDLGDAGGTRRSFHVDGTTGPEVEQRALDPLGPRAGDDAPPMRWRARRIRRGSWGRLAERWVPEPVREARVDPGRRGAVVFVGVALIAGLAAAVTVWTTGPAPQPVAATALAPVTDPVSARPSGGGPGEGGDPSDTRSTTPASAGPPGSAEPGATAPTDAAPAQDVVVSVTGQVRTPGLVTLPPGSRVADAVAAAGGPTDEADLTGFNLASRLADGDSVVIGAVGEVPSAGVSRLAPGSPASGAPTAAAGAGGAAVGGTAGSGLVDLNTADQAALEELPGVGPVMAQAILAWRTEHGAFTDVGQLQDVSGIGPARYAQLQPLVTV